MIEAEPWSYHVDGSPVYSLADIIRKRAAITPGAIAFTKAGRLTSFAELDQRSSQVALALQRKGVCPGDRVAFIGASGPEFAEVMYGAAKCRAIFTAVNNRLSAREVLAILADAAPRVVVVDPRAAPLVADVGTLGFDCDTLITDLDYLAWRDYARPYDPGEEAAPDETALILYTSGTTGVPKGVELTGRNLGCALHELHASIGLDTGSVCAAPIPFFHIAGLGMLLAANLNGGNLLLEQQADIAGVLRLLVDRKVTHAVLVPTVLQRLLALPEARTADWSALSYVVYGASPIPLPVLRDATEIIGCSFLQSYGLTESTGGFTLLGYAVAEWRGRRELSLAADLPPLVAAAAAGALGLEVVQGLTSGPGASLLRAGLSTSGAAYGVAVYHLARQHVRTLRAEDVGAGESATEAA